MYIGVSMIVLNLKSYEKSFSKALYFVDVVSEVVEETGARIIVCPPTPFLKDAAERYGQIFAQHVDATSFGSYTGWLPAEALKSIKVKGSLVNHSEHKLKFDDVKIVVDLLHKNTLESMVCAADVAEAEKIAHLSPTYIAVEPPELIGSGKSVSKEKPELVSNSVKKIKSVNDKVSVLCGAGVSNKKDVEKALQLGSDGVLLASAFVNSADPKKFLQELVSAF